MLGNHLPPEATAAVLLTRFGPTRVCITALTPRLEALGLSLRSAPPPTALVYVWPVVTAALAVSWCTGGPGVSSPSLGPEVQQFPQCWDGRTNPVTPLHPWTLNPGRPWQEESLRKQNNHLAAENDVSPSKSQFSQVSPVFSKKRKPPIKRVSFQSAPLNIYRIISGISHICW